MYGHRLATLVFALTVVSLSPASAQNATSWLSRDGNDANSCAVLDPCLSLYRAYQATYDGGTIRCLDAGDYGHLTISKSITIACQSNESSFAGGNIKVHSPTPIQVVLKGLVFQGNYDAVPLAVNLDIYGPASVTVENCEFRDAKAGYGVWLRNYSGVAELSIKDSVVTGNQGAGIRLAPTSNGSAKVTISNSKITDNGAGIQADTSGTNGSISLTVVDTVLDGNLNSGLAIVGGWGQVAALADRVTSVNNGSHGMRAARAGAVLRISASNITGNLIGTEATAGAVIQSFGDNRIIGNNSGNGPLPLVGAQ